ncbi:hypothetical protein [Nodosilinea nodulosa]|nr:hypothetical protein [Nodosilinea nodulosa]
MDEVSGSESQRSRSLMVNCVVLNPVTVHAGVKPDGPIYSTYAHP